MLNSIDKGFLSATSIVVTDMKTTTSKARNQSQTKPSGKKILKHI